MTRTIKRLSWPEAARELDQATEHLDRCRRELDRAEREWQSALFNALAAVLAEKSVEVVDSGVVTD